MALVAMVALYAATAIALAAMVRWIERSVGGAPGASQLGSNRRRLAAAVWITLLPLAFTGLGFLPQRTLAPTLVVARVPPWLDPRLQWDVGRASSPNNPLLLDAVSQIIPWDRSAREDLLFNPSQGAGAALLGNAQSAVLFPTDALARLLPPFRAVTFRQAARVLLAAWGMFLLVRILGYGELAAVVASTVLAGSGFMELWRLYPQTNVAALAPWMLALAVVLLRRPGPRPAVALAAAGAIAALGGHPETLFHASLFVAAAAPFLVRVGRDPSSPPPRLGAQLGWGAIAVALALLLAAPFLVPVLDNLLPSAEWTMFRGERRAHLGGVPLEEVLERLRPGAAVAALGDPRRGTWSGRENLAELGGGALGAPALLLLFLGLAADRRRLLPLFLVGALGLLLSAHMPVISVPFAWVPLLRDSLWTRLSLWWVLAGSVLAAAGAEALLARRVRLTTVATAAASVLLLVAVVGAGAPGDEASRIRALEIVPLLALLLAALLVLFSTARATSGAPASGREGGARTGLAVALLLAALVVPRSVEFARWIPVTPAAGFFPPTAATAKVAGKLQALPKVGYRVSSTYSGLAPHSAAFFGFEDIRFYDAITFAPYREFLGALGTVPRFGWIQLVRPHGPVLDYLGVRFLFDHPTAHRTRPSALLHRGHDAVVWERHSALPRAFFPGAVEVVSGDDAAVEAAKKIESFARLAIVTAPDPAARSADGAPLVVSGANPATRVIELQVAPGEILALVEADADAVLVTSQPAIPGWRLRLDDQPGGERALRVNGAFLGAAVPAGTHRIDFSYRPRSWRIGLALGAAGAVAAVALLAVRRR